ncbi:MAG: SusC/RagA family TonB-linked outer membrane protein [Pseudobacter sp.]|uniref:SusC/RagA family TonB-linked outer membrane protein n=1 Tax=Pseudobacter sp. TaxID=2045420 RepID=UPI003F80029A
MRNFVLLPVPKRARELIMYSALLLLLASSSLSVYAQAKRPLDKKINYKVSNVSLAEALRKLKELSGVHISFQQDEVSKQPNISVELSDKSGRQVLDKILAGTSLVYVEGTTGDILLVTRQTKKESVRAGKLYNVNGQVVDNQGAPLSNVSIMVLPEKRGLTTDSKGVFNLTAKENDILRFSYLGMKTEQVVVKKDDFIKIALDTAPTVMTEYVVTGYQKIDKRMLTGAVTVLKAEDFMQPGVASVAQMLQGKVPGMTTVFNSGSPSAAPKIRIRGTSTILGNAAPLWVVDDIIREDKVNLNPLQLNAALADASNSNFAIVGNAIAGVNPNDIESVTVLKDAAATSVYGVRAANGVIVVRTKRGKAGPTSFGYSSSVGFTGRPNYDQLYLMNSQERVNFSREMINDGIYYATPPIDISYEGLVVKLNNREITQEEFAAKVKELEYMNTDWLKMLTRNALNHTHSISISGGTGKTTYYFSGGYNSNKGAMKGDDLELYSARANLDIDATRKLRISIGLDASYRKASGFYGLNPLDYALRTSRAISPDQFYQKGTASVSYGGVTYNNPIHYNFRNELAQSGNSNSGTDANLVASLNYRVMKGLTFTANYGMSAASSTTFAFQSDRTHAVAIHRGFDFGAFDKSTQMFQNSRFPNGGVAYPQNVNSLNFTARHQLRYDLNLFENRDQFSIDLGNEIRSLKSDGISSVEIGYYPDRGNTYFSDAYTAAPAPRHSIVSTNTLENYLSWMGMVSYRLLGKYTVYGTVRTDGSNRFGQYSNSRFLPNWVISGRWDVHSENWFRDRKWLTQLSIRASYGSAGNVVRDVGPNLIAKYPSNPFDTRSGESLLELKSLPYPELRWEKTKSYNLGVDASFFEGRVNLSFNAYRKVTSDLLTSKNIGQEYGMAQMYMNYGEMNNSGWDGTITVTPVRKKNFEWSQTFNFSYVKNEVGNSQSLFTLFDYLNGTVILPGTPLESFYSFNFTGLSPQNGLPLYDFRYKKEAYNPDDPGSFLVYSGPRDPTLEFGSTTSIRYKRFSFGANFVVKTGNKRRLNKLFSTGNAAVSVPNEEANLSREYLDRWRKPGDEKYTNIPAFTNIPAGSPFFDVDMPVLSTFGKNPYMIYDYSTARLVSGNYLRCTSMSLGYTFADKKLLKWGVRNMTLSGFIANPFIITSKEFRGQDPEASNLGSTALPITRSYTLSLGIGF